MSNKFDKIHKKTKINSFHMYNLTINIVIYMNVLVIKSIKSILKYKKITRG